MKSKIFSKQTQVKYAFIAIGLIGSLSLSSCGVMLEAMLTPDEEYCECDDHHHHHHESSSCGSRY